MTCMGNKPRDVYRSGEVTPRRVYNFCRGEKKKILLLWLFRKAVLSPLTRMLQCLLLGKKCFPDFCSCKRASAGNELQLLIHTASQNCWGGKRLSGADPVQRPAQAGSRCRWHRHCPGVFGCLRRGRLHSLAGQRVQVPCHPQCKVLPYIEVKLLVL